MYFMLLSCWNGMAIAMYFHSFKFMELTTNITVDVFLQLNSCTVSIILSKTLKSSTLISDFDYKERFAEGYWFLVFSSIELLLWFNQWYQVDWKNNFGCSFWCSIQTFSQWNQVLLWWEKCTSAVTRRVAEQVMRRHAPECGHQGPGVGASLASADSVGVSYQDCYFGWSLLSRVC